MIAIKKYSDLTRDELFDILKLRTDIFVVEQNCPYPELDEEDKRAFHLIQVENQIVIGTLRIITNSNKSYCKIGRVAVHKDYRKRGYGKLIMEAALAFIKSDLKEKLVVISAQQYLDAFYNNLGFKNTGKKYLEDGIPHQEMTLEL